MVESYGRGYIAGGYAPVDDPPEPPPPFTPVTPVNRPRLSVLVDFIHDINPTEEMPEPIWTELAATVRTSQGFSTNRGATQGGRSRAATSGGVEVGTGTIRLGDPTGDLDPDNDNGAYFPNVKADKRIQIAGLTESTYDPWLNGQSLNGENEDLQGGGEGDIRTVFFDGLTDAFAYAYPGPGFDAIVDISFHDWLGPLAGTTFDWNMFVIDGDVQPNPVRYARDAMNEILDFKPFAARRKLPSEDPDNPLSVQVQNVVYDDANMLEALKKLALTDGGLFYADREGEYRYRLPSDQFDPIDDRLRFSVQFQPLKDLTTLFDNTTVYNKVQITTQFGTSLFQDNESIRAHFEKPPLQLDLQFEDPTDITTRGQDLLFRFGQPQRIISMLDLSNVVVDWPLILGMDLWDKCFVTVDLGNTVTFSQYALVEGIQIVSTQPADWRVIVWLSPAPFANVFTEAQSSFETDEGGWTAVTNCTVESSSVGGAVRGARSLRVLPVVDGDVVYQSPLVPVDPRISYQAFVPTKWRSNSGPTASSRDGHVDILWYDASGTLLSSHVGADVDIPASFNKWGNLTDSARAPSGARQARLRVTAESIPVPTGGNIGFTGNGGVYSDGVRLQRLN